MSDPGGAPGLPPRPPRAAVGRADLLEIAARSPEGLAEAAASLGFFRPKPAGPGPISARSPPPAPPGPGPDLPKLDLSEPAEPVRFWRMEEMTFFDEAPPDPRPPDGVPPADHLSDEDLQGPGSLFDVPRSPSLAAWRKIWPAVQDALHGFVLGRDPDVGVLVRAWGRGEVVARIPRVVRRTWAARASLWLDRSVRLGPFWHDQLDVWHRLRQACGRAALEVRWLDARAQARALRRGGDLLGDRCLDPETRVLVLGDLGTYGSDADRAAWLRTARRLRAAGVRPTALIPGPPARWAPEARAWSTFSWEDGRRGVARPARCDGDRWQARAGRLLRLVSPAALVQPGLLRALRLLLPAGETDAAAEADAWAHPDVRAADGSGLVLRPSAAIRLREQFANEETAAVKEAVSGAIRAWHERLPKQLLRAETLAWIGVEPEADPPGGRRDALDFVARMGVSARLAAQGRMDPRQATAARLLERKALLSMPDEVYRRIPGLDLVWASAFAGVRGMRVPEGVDAARLAAELTPGGVERWWAVRQVGTGLELSPSPGPAWPSHVEGPGSPVAWLLASGPSLCVGRTQVPLEAGPLPVDPGEEVRLRTDRCTVKLGVWEREAWAVAAGRDRFGLWADQEVKGVVQRFRWIPPGRFRMGSPEGEDGRYPDEGPQHVVTWTLGRWLADTPVTQALWEAVRGKNPSRFVSAGRPVEQVDWTQSNALAQEVGARLPSEAEWEYACRAGTETATWVGDLEIRGKNDAPLLDDIAWYRGNCGVDFELDEGEDTTGPVWEEKQHDFAKGGTHPVGQKAPNPFGLFDVLGNVWEWCEDAWASAYSEGHLVDPSPHGGTTGSSRVLRGGSWLARAGFVRAAFRGAGAPGYRLGDLGFRLARGQSSLGAEPGPGTRSGPKARDAGRSGADRWKQNTKSQRIGPEEAAEEAMRLHFVTVPIHGSAAAEDELNQFPTCTATGPPGAGETRAGAGVGVGAVDAATKPRRWPTYLRGGPP